MTVSACLMIKDENEYLEEWLKYHNGVGVDKFYIYDNNSSEPVKEYIESNSEINDLDIEVYEWNVDKAGRHILCFNDLIEKKKGNDEWCCFIDIDEFIVPTKYEDIKDMIDNYSDYSAIKIQRYNFGDNGHKNKPNGWVITNYLLRCDDEGRGILKTGGKSIVYLKNIKGIKNLHNFNVVGNIAYPVTEEMQINHYFTKSQEEWEDKMAKGGGNGAVRGWKQLNKNNEYCNYIKDDKILNFIKE